MRYLNYTEIRTLVKSGKISIDLNNNVFSHPYYMEANISDLDFELKNRAFNGDFLKITDSSFNPAYKDLLENRKSLKIHLITTPINPYINIRELKGLNKIISKFKNYFWHNDSIKIKPKNTAVLPISINIIENLKIPEVNVKLSEELLKQGLVLVSIKPSFNSSINTYIVVFNTSNKPIMVNDLSYLGELFFIQS
ncbi:MAG: hypothetical protein [Bacteriophage sp.]|nr:MAG: hypothetical protein [Bacteriophage sp.]